MEHQPGQIYIGTGTIVKIILVSVLFYLIFVLKGLVLVVLMSIVIASAVEPMAKWFVDRKIPRLLGVILIYLTIASLLAVTVLYLLVPLLGESVNILKTLPTYFSSDTVSSTIEKTDFLSSQPELVSGLKSTFNIQELINQMTAMIDSFSVGAFNTIAYVFGGLMNFVLMIVLSFYLSVDEGGVRKFLRIITPLKHEPYVLDLWSRAQMKIGLWMQGQLILAVIIAMLVYLGLTLLGVPNALLFAFLAGVFEIIPLFGPILASIPAIMIAFVNLGFSTALGVIGLYLIIHQFENHLIYPLVVKKVTGVPPIMSIIALVAGWEIAGFLGLLISVPLITALMEFFDDLERDKIEKIERMKMGA